MSAPKSSTPDKRYAKRLPPLWWIRMRIKVAATPSARWLATYRWGNQTWGCDSETIEDAVAGLVESLRVLKDGSTLADYYRRYSEQPR